MIGLHRLCCYAMIASSAFSWPSRAHAEPPNPPDTAGAPSPAPLASVLQGKAKNDYEAGRLLADSGDFAGALLKFQSAYLEADDPRLLWNAAACERNLHHYAKAIVLVRRFLESNPSRITPEAAASARAFLEAAEPLTAPLRVESNPPNAQVYLDEERLGAPELMSEVRIDLGTHKIVVEAPGFARYTQTLTVTSSSQVHVRAILKPDAVVMPPLPGPPLTDLPAPSSPASALPRWLWVAGGCVVLAGVAAGSYFVFKPSAVAEPVPGSIATYRF